MNTIRTITDIVGSLIGNVVIITFFELIWHRRIRQNIVYYSIHFFAGILMCAASNIFQNTAVMPALLLLAVFGLSFLYSSRWFSKVFYSLIMTILLGISELISGLLLMLVKGEVIIWGNAEDPLYLIALLLSNFIVFSLVKIFSLITRRKQVQFKRKYATYVIYPLTSIIVLLVFLFLSDSPTGYRLSPYILFSSVLLVASNISVLLLADRQELLEEEKRRLEQAESQIKIQTEHTERIYSLVSTTQKMWHDMKNELAALIGMLSGNQVEPAIRYIEDIVGEVSNLYAVINTGYPMVDSILQYKLRFAEDSGCRLKIGITLPKHVLIDEMDFALILANGLDNAIEATRRINGEDKEINLRIFYQGNYLSVTIVNPINNYLNIKKLKTSKKSNENNCHGMGLSSIRALARKYDGNVNIECENQTFFLRILLKNEKPLNTSA